MNVWYIADVRIWMFFYNILFSPQLGLKWPWYMPRVYMYSTNSKLDSSKNCITLKKEYDSAGNMRGNSTSSKMSKSHHAVRSLKEKSGVATYVCILWQAYKPSFKPRDLQNYLHDSDCWCLTVALMLADKIQRHKHNCKFTLTWNIITIRTIILW